jgi:hypothetical protein
MIRVHWKIVFDSFVAAALVRLVKEMVGLLSSGCGNAQNWRPTRVVTKSTGVFDSYTASFRWKTDPAVH